MECLTKKLLSTHVVEPYLLQDLIVKDDRGTYHFPNEITLLKEKNLSPELKDRLGLIMGSRPNSISGDNPDRYNQSILGRQKSAEQALEELSEEERKRNEYADSLKSEPTEPDPTE